jgi:hypothetical protein
MGYDAWTSFWVRDNNLRFCVTFKTGIWYICPSNGSRRRNDTGHLKDESGYQVSNTFTSLFGQRTRISASWATLKHKFCLFALNNFVCIINHIPHLGLINNIEQFFFYMNGPQPENELNSLSFYQPARHFCSVTVRQKYIHFKFPLDHQLPTDSIVLVLQPVRPVLESGFSGWLLHSECAAEECETRIGRLSSPTTRRRCTPTSFVPPVRCRRSVWSSFMELAITRHRRPSQKSPCWLFCDRGTILWTIREATTVWTWEARVSI